MSKRVTVYFCIFMLSFIGSALSQRSVLTENFESGTTSLNWFSAWEDSLGTPLTPMVPSNETGPSDDWIGVVSGNLEVLGGLGAALAGDATLANYSMEAQVYVELNGGFYNGIMVRTDTTNGKVVGYQLVANFNAMFGAQRVRFRYFSQNRDEIRTLAEIQAADLPGGAPTADGWHKMKIKAVDNQFWLYWDDQEIAGSPFTDPEAAVSQGFFGVYVWDAMSGVVPTTKIDDIIVREETAGFETLEEDFTGGISSLDWFSAWEDSLGTPLTPMVPTNETGPSDDWIGVVSGNLEVLGGLGAALAGDATLANYSMEAQVYVELNGGFYNGIMVRTDTTNGKVVGYQLVANFNTMFGAQRVRFRYFSQNRDEIRTLAEIQAADLPGGAPTADGWHKMKIKAIDNQFWLYWDDQEIAGSPFTDPEAALSQGFFGVYVWDAMSGVVPTTKIDDIIVLEETSTGVEEREDKLATLPKQFALYPNYPNPFNPETNISYQIGSAEHLTITIHDMLGRKIKTLVSGHHAPGFYSTMWDGKDDHGAEMASGVYTYTLESEGVLETKKMLMVK